jgi:hypothetical protein
MESFMKFAAIKYRVLENTTDKLCCVIAVKKNEIDPSDIAKKFADSLDHPRHKTAYLQEWE